MKRIKFCEWDKVKKDHMTIRNQTIKALNNKYGVDLKTATDEELITFMEYYKMNGTIELFKQLRSYEHDK